MFDIPIQDLAIVQERTIENAQSMPSSIAGAYEFSEVDLSFYDALAGLCSGEASSGPINRPTAGKTSGRIS